MYRYIKVFLWCFSSGVIVILLGSGYFYFSYHADIKNVHYSQGKNALWARHQWVGEYRTVKEYVRLATHLKQHEMTDVFFHVGPLNAQGLIEQQKYPFAVRLLSYLKREYPELHIQAWIGQVEARGGGPLDLSNNKVRENIVHTAEMFLDLGFDGIHYDIEPIHSGDMRFLDLLQKTKAITKNQKKFLSVASDEPEPIWGTEKIVRLFAKQAGFWKKEYYIQVAEQVDQIAVMIYDTALPRDWLYGNVVAWVTKTLLTSLDPKITLFMGVPSYEDQRWGFHPEAENVRSGIRGIQKGLASFDTPEIQHFGIAIYAEWTTDQDEWDVYTQEWLNTN